MEQRAVLRTRHDGLADLSVPAIASKLAGLGQGPELSDIGISNSLVADADAAILSATPGRESWRPTVEKTRPAGVLVALVDRPEGLQVLLTRRTDHLHHHAGQISFPGGRKEDSDATLVDTALREANEEIGLDSRLVTILGQLPQYVTLTRFAITPVVGVIAPPFDLRADPFEVADIFEVPLAYLADTTKHERHFREENGVRRGFYAIPYNDRFIWGATAGILVNFAHLLAHHG